MHEARLRPHDLGEMGQEGDDVVLGLALDLVDARDVEGRLAALVARSPSPPPSGSMPSAAIASAACASISNQMRNRVSGDQIAVISGRE